jgi:glutathione peroxidase
MNKTMHATHGALGLLAALMLGSAPRPVLAATACPAVLQYSMPRLQDEKSVDLCSFAGRVVVVVNTASQCGYTPQYQGLEALHQRYAKRGLVVLGFPSNDFGGQEPGGNAAIADFCENQFAVRFPMFAKTTVRGRPNAFYAGLAAKTGTEPGWNFHKYIVSRNGEIVISHPSAIEPQDPRFLKDIERLLDAK